MKSIFALVALTLIYPACAGTLPLSELEVGGIALGATEASVVGRMGEPLQRLDTGEGIELHYPGLVATVGWLEQQAPGREPRVAGIFGSGPQACTPRGLCPGMPVAAADRLSGTPEVAQREAGEFLEYYPEATGCWLQVAAAAGSIRSVAVACQP